MTKSMKNLLKDIKVATYEKSFVVWLIINRTDRASQTVNFKRGCVWLL